MIKPSWNQNFEGGTGLKNKPRSRLQKPVRNMSTRIKTFEGKNQIEKLALGLARRKLQEFSKTKKSQKQELHSLTQNPISRKTIFAQNQIFKMELASKPNPKLKTKVGQKQNSNLTLARL